MKSFRVLDKESHVLVLIQEARPDDGEYGVGSWRLEHLEGEGEELDDGEDGDEGDEDGHLIIMMMMMMKKVMMMTMKTVTPEEMPFVLLGQSSPRRSQGIVPT